MAQEVTQAKGSLFELIETELKILQQLEDNEGELTPAMELALSQVQLDRAEKLDACKYMIDQFELRAESLKRKEEEIRALRKRCETVAEGIKQRIKDSMGALGIAEANGHDYRFKLITQSKQKCVISGAVPPEYEMVVTERMPDKERIAQDLALGLEIPGASLEPIVQLRSYVNSNVTKAIKK